MSTYANILVIDDEESIRDACEQALSSNDINVEAAENGLEGLSLLKDKCFDIIILDLKMPGLSGMDVLKKIRENNPETMVIIITGFATIESAVEAMKYGAYDFIPKPFAPDSLRGIVKRALDRRELALENVLLRSELKESLGPEVIIGQSKSMKKVEELTCLGHSAK